MEIKSSKVIDNCSTRTTDTESETSLCINEQLEDIWCHSTCISQSSLVRNVTINYFLVTWVAVHTSEISRSKKLGSVTYLKVMISGLPMHIMLCIFDHGQLIYLS